MPTVAQATAKTKANIAAKKAAPSSSSSSGSSAKVGDTVNGKKVTGTRGGVPYRFEGEGVNKSDTPTPFNPSSPTTVEDTPQSPEQVTGSFDATNPDTTGQLAYGQAVKNLNSGGLTGPTLAGAQNSLANKYQQAHQSLTESGGDAPADAALARTAVTGALPPSPPDTSAVDQIFSEDPTVNTLMQNASLLLSASKY